MNDKIEFLTEEIGKAKSQTHTMEKYCIKLTEDFQRAGISSERVCPQCDTNKLEKDFRPNDYICGMCRIEEERHMYYP